MDDFEKNLKDVIFSEAKDVIFQKQNIPCVQSVWNHKFRVFALFRSWKSGKFLQRLFESFSQADCFIFLRLSLRSSLYLASKYFALRCRLTPP